jgi:Sulfotransferase domain
MNTVVRKLLREVRMLFHRHRRAAEQVAAERRLRGRDDFKRLRKADCVIVSFGKSGRTWVRVMLSRFYQRKHGLAERHLLAFDNLHRKNRAIPKFFFTHDNYLKDFTGHSESKVDYYDKKVVLLVRNPADVAVSQYFQWKFRMRPRKKTINQYPNGEGDVDIFDFVMRPQSGLKKIVDFMNLWAAEADRFGQLHIVRYEDLRRAPEETLGRLLAFLGTPASAEQLADAVEFASVDNMRKLETKRVFWLSGSRMAPADRSNPDSYKVRRGKVGGYRDYFDDGQIARIDAIIGERLSPFFGYGSVQDLEPAANG